MNNAVLIIDDEPILAKNLKTYLIGLGYEVCIAASGEEGLAEIDRFHPDIVLLDYRLEGIDGLQVLQRIHQNDPGIKVLFMTGHGNVQLAVDAMKAGAYDFFSKPIELAAIKLVLEKALKQDRIAKTLAYYQQRDAQASGFTRMLGESALMLQLKQKLQRIIDLQRDAPSERAPAVLISGETGTGKELVARALHFEGVRKDKPFVELNCAAIPAQLLESELFGFERGAFTDAKQRKQGLVETANGGTLFLDEIAEMELPLQAKILKLLEDRSFRRLGGLREQHVDIQIVSATNRSLAEWVKEGRFRSDLFFRLRQIDIEVPPLRSRGDDILLLARHFLAGLSSRYGKNFHFDKKAECALKNYSWMGNIRELRNVVEQSAFLSDSDTIGHQALIQNFIGDGGRISMRSNVCMLCMMDDDFPAEGIDLDQLEQDIVLRSLTSCDWNVTQAAKLLHISRDTLRYRMEKHQLKAPV